jgi:hypothetical protein
MAANSERDDARPAGDALDGLIDEALESTLRCSPVDLRSQVLASLDAPVADRAAPRIFVFRPALLPVAGAILLIAGVAITWRHVNLQLGRAEVPAARTAASRTGVSPTGTTPPPVDTLVQEGTRASAITAVPAAPRITAPGSGRVHRNRSADTRIVASAWLAMDAMTGPAIRADSVIAGDDPEPSLPGAPAGDLGDPIAPMPRLRPIVIPPIVAAPIVEAPPVSTLAAPVSTLSTDDRSRGRTGPGKTGGVRP